MMLFENIPMLTFSDPLWLLALIIIPGIIVFKRFSKREYYPAVMFSNLEDLLKVSKKRHIDHSKIASALGYVALALLIIAMAQPRFTIKDHHASNEGIDIIITLDISLSMLARDFYPDRLEASKDVAARFINDRINDRIGIVLFAGETYTLCPLTKDKATLINFLRKVNAGFIEDGSTAIGDGIAASINRLRESEAKSKVIILLTDGENNAGHIDPLQAAEIAAMFGIKVYTVGVGSQGTAIGPKQIIGNNIIFGPVEVYIDEPTLKKVAEISNGKYYRAIDEKSLEEIYNEIDRLEKSKLEVAGKYAHVPLFTTFISAALLLLFALWIIRYVFVKSIP